MDRVDPWDVLALLGIVLLGTGLGLLAPWLGLASAGLALLALGIGGALVAERTRGRDQRKGS
ncbi:MULTISPECIES: hypothetical protein [unclassified Streptomyces]|uniref:hypothetical protein n=1 Tax=unclassified Streptomyces TaxID=2593676 RepID=UPI0035D80EA1